MFHSIIQDFPRVTLYTRTEGKFIVVILEDKNNEKKVVVRGGDIDQYHHELEKHLKKEVLEFGMKASCIGGGKYRVNFDEKTVYVWAESGEFGKEPNRNETLQLFQEAFPGFIIPELSLLELYRLGLMD